MIREVDVNGAKIIYDLQYKKVKNINLRIKGDGKVFVSANRRVPMAVIDGFVREKATFIEKAREHFGQKAETPKVQYCTEQEIKEEILSLCKKVHLYYAPYGIPFPHIKFRDMVSRWGSCHKEKGIITFNTQLMYAPPQCIEYVVWHEFTHFLEPNHSRAFYEALEMVCPDWKVYRKKLKEICLR